MAWCATSLTPQSDKSPIFWIPQTPWIVILAVPLSCYPPHHSSPLTHSLTHILTLPHFPTSFTLIISKSLLTLMPLSLPLPYSVISTHCWLPGIGTRVSDRNGSESYLPWPIRATGNIKYCVCSITACNVFIGNFHYVTYCVYMPSTLSVPTMCVGAVNMRYEDDCDW